MGEGVPSNVPRVLPRLPPLDRGSINGGWFSPRRSVEGAPQQRLESCRSLVPEMFGAAETVLAVQRQF